MFLDDIEKMRDFVILNKDEFLKEYSYLDEREYENTKIWFDKLKDIAENFESLTASDYQATLEAIEIQTGVRFESLNNIVGMIILRNKVLEIEKKFDLDISYIVKF